MAHITRENKAEPIAEYAIYIIFSPFERKFMTGKCLQKNLKGAYKEHYNLRIMKTKSLFEKAKQHNLLPPIYLLEVLECSARQAFKHCVAWTKLFAEKGYEPMFNDSLTKYANDITKETEEIYNQIKEKNINEICAKGQDLFPNYGRGKAPIVSGSTPKTVHFSVRPEEYEKLKTGAKKSNLSLASYCKQRALYGKTVNIDFDFMMDYMKQFTENKNILRQILYVIYTKCNYYPADLANIQGLVDDLIRLQNETNKCINDALKVLDDYSV